MSLFYICVIFGFGGQPLRVLASRRPIRRTVRHRSVLRFGVLANSRKHARRIAIRGL